jgi:hypothetical protein
VDAGRARHSERTQTRQCMCNRRRTIRQPIIFMSLMLPPKNRDWYERETAEKAFTLTGCVL